MTPEQIAKAGTEHAHQAAYFCWCSQHSDERLRFAFAIPNGGKRTKVTASRLKAEGVRAGVPDTFLPIPVGMFHGLWIEFKKPGDKNKKKGRLDPEQIKWRDFLKSQNYGHFVAFTYRQAIEVTVQYLRHA